MSPVPRSSAPLVFCCYLVTKSCMSLCEPMCVVHQALLSMGFPRQEHWSLLPFPSTGNLLNPGKNPHFLYTEHKSLPLSHLGSPLVC